MNYTKDGFLLQIFFFFYILDHWLVEKGNNTFDWNVKTLKVKFDGVHVMRWDEFILCKGSNYQELTKSYRKAAGLTQKSNIAWYEFF